MQPTKLFVSADGRSEVGPQHAIASNEPITLRCPKGKLGLSIRLNYVIIERREAPADERYKVSTQRYQHALVEASTGSEVIAWHWHPGDAPANSNPHIHVTGGVGEYLKRQGHVPSGRVTVESVVRYVLHDLQARSKRGDWSKVLDDCERDFRTFATWGSRRPR